MSALDFELVSSAVMRRAPTKGERPVRELGQRLFEALPASYWAQQAPARRSQPGRGRR